MLQLSRGPRPWALKVANEVKLQLLPALFLKDREVTLCKSLGRIQKELSISLGHGHT